MKSEWPKTFISPMGSVFEIYENGAVIARSEREQIARAIPEDIRKMTAINRDRVAAGLPPVAEVQEESFTDRAKRFGWGVWEG